MIATSSGAVELSAAAEDAAEDLLKCVLHFVVLWMGFATSTRHVYRERHRTDGNGDGDVDATIWSCHLGWRHSLAILCTPHRLLQRAGVTRCVRDRFR